MTNSKILPVILAGGSGTRLWPLSRTAFPKQFINLVNDFSMFQNTILRLDGLDVTDPYVICNEDHRFIVAEQLRAIDKNFNSVIILEPDGRNTAPAIALAGGLAMQNEDEPLLLILPADHQIKNKQAFNIALKQAIPIALSGKLVTFGIVVTEPNVGYGYIKQGEQLGEGYIVEKFVEKPDLATATMYYQSDKYLWNSGMFLFKASRYLDELKNNRPDIHRICAESIENTITDLDFIRIKEKPFLQCPEDSIDYAVMEQTKDAVVIPLDAEWSDVGSWAALWEVNEKTQNNNVVKGDVLQIDTNNCLIHGEDRLVATIGMKDCIIVDTKDSLLVASKEQAQEVKDIVSLLKEHGRDEYKLHREVYRPWGKYDSVDSGRRFQVKRITVKPGEKLSVQMHHHRAEHWIIVSGTAKVTNGDKEIILTENQSTYIPIGVIHALENPGKIPLELIEVQSGDYLGEDDIVRFEDRYGRTNESNQNN